MAASSKAIASLLPPSSWRRLQGRSRNYLVWAKQAHDLIASLHHLDSSQWAVQTKSNDEDKARGYATLMDRGVANMPACYRGGLLGSLSYLKQFFLFS